MINIIAKKTEAAEATEGYYYFSGSAIHATVVVSGDLGSDTIPIMYVGSDGTFTQAYDKEGTALVLSQSNPAISIEDPMHIRAAKGATTNAIGVDIHGIG